MTPTLELKEITRSFQQGDEVIQVLKSIDLTIAPGEIVALVGPSGAGKTTLLQIAGLLELPNGGSVMMNGRNCNHLADGERTDLRREFAGFVYQFHNLLQEFSALENVMLPLLISGKTRVQAKGRAEDLLERLGLSHRLNHRPMKLSGGEQQRVAIARALASDAKVLLADEPTGNLDTQNGKNIIDILKTLAKEQGYCVIVVTHDLGIAAEADEVLHLSDGMVKAE